MWAHLSQNDLLFAGYRVLSKILGGYNSPVVVMKGMVGQEVMTGTIGSDSNIDLECLSSSERQVPPSFRCARFLLGPPAKALSRRVSTLRRRSL